MSIRHAAAVLLVLSFSTAQLHAAQAITVSGTVVDARTGAALAGVLVIVDGQPVFTETTTDGRFAVQLPAGTYTLSVSLVGYSLVRLPIEVTKAERPALTIELFEGAGRFADHVTVAGAAPVRSEGGPLPATVYGRELQALRGVVLDDPLRALHALPSVAATDDFYSEFAVRGLGFRHTGVAVDGMPSSALMHAVHGVSDGGSIAMINSDAVGSLSLSPGSHPQRLGRRIGAQAGLTPATAIARRTRARARPQRHERHDSRRRALGSRRPARGWYRAPQLSRFDPQSHRRREPARVWVYRHRSQNRLRHHAPSPDPGAGDRGHARRLPKTAEDLGLNDEAPRHGPLVAIGIDVALHARPHAAAGHHARLYDRAHLSTTSITPASRSRTARSAECGLAYRCHASRRMRHG